MVKQNLECAENGLNKLATLTVISELIDLDEATPFSHLVSKPVLSSLFSLSSYEDVGKTQKHHSR